MSPTFTLLMPVWSNTSSCERAIQSIQKQTFSNWELLLLDSRESGFVATDERIRRYALKGGSPVHMINHILSTLTSPYWSILSPQTYMHPEWLRILYTLLTEEPDLDICACWMESAKPCGGIKNRCQGLIRNPLLPLLQNNFINAPTAVCKSSFFQRNGILFQGEALSFYDFWTQAAEKEAQIYIEPFALAHTEDPSYTEPEKASKGTLFHIIEHLINRSSDKVELDKLFNEMKKAEKTLHVTNSSIPLFFRNIFINLEP